MTRNTYSARGQAARTALHQSTEPWKQRPKKVSVCTACQGKIRYMIGSTYGLWAHVGETTCTADPNRTCDRSQIREEDA